MDHFIPTSEAARRLGVKPATLYAYVSRGLLRSIRQPGQQESLFDRQEIEQLGRSNSSARRESPNLLRFRAVVTQVSRMDETHLYLRGHPMDELCGHVTFLEAARIVLARPKAEAIRLQLPAAPCELVQSLQLNRRLPVAIALLGALDPQRESLDPDRHAGWSLGLIGLAPSLAGPEIELADPLVQALLVSLIDNGLAASTTAARVAASARAGWYDTQSAGLAALAGRLHGTAPVEARRLLRDVLQGHPVSEAVRQREDTLGHMPGFGHMIYRGDDPRARALMDLLRVSRNGTRELEALHAIQRAIQRPVNVDGMSAVICEALRLPDQAGEFLFQLSRTAGITAHALEEYQEAPLRWRATSAA
ncbi:citrate/2-methylcitrate synthase [Ottowia sp. VDI28]|uniref:citrate/2-methylcitrate synthase n=1 Tax=Ottowia sp. VDI28 TaxID=3133968 RepID=UPI003C2DF3D7